MELERPWRPQTPSLGDTERFTINVDKRTIEQAQGFDRDNWPDMSDIAWGGQLCSYYRVEPYWDGGEPHA